MQPSSLHIGRLYNRYLVPHEHGAPEEVRDLCESALATTLPESLAIALRRALPAENSSLCFIRRLDVDFAVNTDMHFSGLPEVLANEIATGVTDALQQGGPEVLHFPDRASYLAQFFLDLAEGSAWDKWYYASLHGLRMLPVSAALRTPICDSPEIGLHALRSLQNPSLVLKQITGADAARILTAFEFSTLSVDESAYFRAIANLWQTVLSIPPRDEERRALLLFVSVARNDSDLANKTLVDAARAVCRLARYLEEEHPAENRDLLSALRRGDVSNFYRLAGLEQAAMLSPLLRCEAECLDQLLQRVADGSATDPKTRQETRLTAFGGAFLLFDLLDQLPLHDATAGWPGLENVSAVSLARLMILAKCFGTSRATGCFCDLLVRDLLLIPPQITPEMVRKWLGGISRDHLSRFARTIANWHLETAAAEGHTYSLISVPRKRAPVVLLLDNARGVWLFAGRAINRTEALRELPSPEKILCQDSLIFVAQESFPDVAIEALNGSLASSPGRDLEHLALPPEFGHGSAELALSVAAQGVLRLFACKLPGFSNSSFDYLFSNFLDCFAAVEEREDKRVVFLSGPPLHLVLRMTGLNRRNYKLGWLDVRPFAVFPEG